ncbi:MAG: helix-turn-helix domain-containing protein [Pseudomonadota bacterium]
MPDDQSPEAQPERTQAEREILAAAAALFSELGFEGASLDAVAKRMGATKGRVYHYFRSKTALFCAVYQDAMDRLEARIAAAAAPHAEPAARLSAMAAAHVAALIEDRAAHRVGFIGIDAAARAAARADDHAALEALRRRQVSYEARFEAAIAAAAPAEAAPDGTAVKTFLLSLNGVLFFRAERQGARGGQKDALARRIARQALFGVLASATHTEETTKD